MNAYTCMKCHSTTLAYYVVPLVIPPTVAPYLSALMTIKDFIYELGFFSCPVSALPLRW